MKVYVFKHSGHYLGGAVVIVGGTIKQATVLAVKELKDNGVDRGAIYEVREFDCVGSEPVLVHLSNGDY